MTEQTPGVGHNSGVAAKNPENAEGMAAERLRQIVMRIERLEDEKSNIAADIREVYSEAKSNGFNTKTLRKIIAVRKMDKNEREEMQALIDAYMRALGELF
jgi:uncharacterized protein (UPF0335 family)